MASYTVELDESNIAKANILSAFFKVSMEDLLKEAVDLGLQAKEVRMNNAMWDPDGDPHKGWERRMEAERREMQRTGFWKKKIPGIE